MEAIEVVPLLPNMLIDDDDWLVLWAADEFGYTVKVFDESGHVIETVSGGNCFGDTDRVVGLTDPLCISESRLRVWAKETALECAVDHDIPTNLVKEDPTIRPVEPPPHAAACTPLDMGSWMNRWVVGRMAA